MEMLTANTMTQMCELILVNVSAASAIPDRCAATLTVFASNRAVMAAKTTGLGHRALNPAVMPRPLTMPIRAHVICTVAMSGHVIKAVQRREVPKRAPAIVYVAIPDGS